MGRELKSRVTTPMVDSDVLAQAMRAYQSGDASAFDRLYAALGPVVRRYLRSAARDDARVDDLVQETFLQLHRARRTYNPERPVMPWALAIARHVFLMDCRVRKRKYDRAAVEFDEQIALADPEPGRGPDDAVIARDQLRQGLARLTPGTRRVVLMHHVHGWSFREIAEKLGINSAAAKLRASRGVNALRARLSGRHEDDERQ
jgi:RNA polymerase sigma-70 factor (ECF subfamily)